MSKLSKLFVGMLAICLPAVASAEDYVLGDIPMDLTVGFGMFGFIDNDTRDYAKEGALWEARLGIEPADYLGFEAGYIGTMSSIDALGLDDSASLLGTSVEGAVRVNFMKGAIQPYAHFGAGWTRYSLTDTSVNTSDVADHDNVVHLPMGVGITYRYDRVLFDLRGAYRPTTDNDMLGGQGTTLVTWQGNVKVGYAF
jgi:hypothetical protein